MKIKTAAQAINAKAGVHGAGDGLCLKKLGDEPSSGSWFYRFRLGGKRRDMGLGPLANLSPRRARRRGRWRRSATTAARVREENLAKTRAKAPVTFAEAAENYLEAHGPSWKHR
jgi:hypothetical protein